MLSGIFRQEAERQKINNKVIKFHFILPPEKAKILLKPYTEMILAFQSRSQGVRVKEEDSLTMSL